MARALFPMPCKAAPLRALLACACCALVVLSLLVCRPAMASDGYLTLDGVAGVDSEQMFASLSEALAALAACNEDLQTSDEVTLLVHGAVTVEDGGEGQPGSDVVFAYPLDGATVVVRAATENASLTVVGGRSLALSNPTGSLTVSALVLSGSVALFARDAVAVEACVIDEPLSCDAAEVSVCDTVFSSMLALPDATLSDEDGEQPVYAQVFTPVVLVSYNENGASAGRAPAVSALLPGTSLTVGGMGSLVNPGYSFDGWNVEPDGSGASYAVGQTVVVGEEDLVLYAQWLATGTVGGAQASISAETASA